MDWDIILTAIGVAIAIVGSNIGLIAWLRSDMKAFEVRIDGWKDQFSRDIESWKNQFSRDMASYKDEVKKEMRDFHGRLCTIEERHRKSE